MRITLNVDDDVLAVAKSVAAARGVAMGKALSDLARKGIEQPAEHTTRNGIPVFRVREDAPLLTTEQVKQAEDEV